MQQPCAPGSVVGEDGSCLVPDAGAGGASGTEGATGAFAGSGGGEAGSTGTGARAGSAGVGAPVDGGAAGSEAPLAWVDDACGNYDSASVLVQGDDQCEGYHPDGVCGMGVSAMVNLSALKLEDFAAVREFLVRTPSHPGSMPQCSGMGCSGDNTIAAIRIPIEIPTPIENPNVIKVQHVGTGGNQTGAPWRVIHNYEVSEGKEACSSVKSTDCTEIRNTQVVVTIETADPNAPARDFRLSYLDTGGTCP